jgi:predicted nuclease with TOPRIM domain
MDEQAIATQPALDGLSALDELERRIEGAVERLRNSRQQESKNASEASELRAALGAAEDRVEELAARVTELESERRQVRGRVEKLLARIDQLEA